jgi:phage head maturation protease
MGDPQKPYGDVSYADPGYQKDGKKRYPIDTADHCRAAWSYINQADNASKYSSEHLAAIKGRIKSAAKKFGITIGDTKMESRSCDDDMLMLTPEEIEALNNGTPAATPGAVETRSIANVDDVDFAERTITVIAIPYEQETLVPFQGGVWTEVFSRTAFQGISDRKQKVPVTACLDIPAEEHRGGKLCGRVSAFHEDRPEGLVTDLKISRTPLGEETLQLAADGALHCSIGFRIGSRFDQDLNRMDRKRRVNRALLEHIAMVGEPAYPGAQVLSVRAEGGSAEEAAVVAGTPGIDEYLDDPIFAWGRNLHQS